MNTLFSTSKQRKVCGQAETPYILKKKVEYKKNRGNKEPKP